MIRHSVDYQKLTREKKIQPGRFVSVEAAEHLSGLPRGWTSPDVGAVDSAEFRNGRGRDVVEAVCLATVAGFALFLSNLAGAQDQRRQPFFWHRGLGAGMAEVRKQRVSVVLAMANFKLVCHLRR